MKKLDHRTFSVAAAVLSDSIRDTNGDISAIFWGCGHSLEKNKLFSKNLFEPFAFCCVYVNILSNDFAVRLGLA
jgi:hypothetical protein